MGWDEVATAKLLPGNVAQFWAKEENAILAKNQGNKVLLSPAKKAYLDMQYDSLSRIGLHWAAYIELDSAYLWDPATYVKGLAKADILGVEAPLWSETVTNREDIITWHFHAWLLWQRWLGPPRKSGAGKGLHHEFRFKGIVGPFKG